MSARCRLLPGLAYCEHPACARADRDPRGRPDGEDDLQVGDDLGLTWPEARRPRRHRGVVRHHLPHGGRDLYDGHPEELAHSQLHPTDPPAVSPGSENHP